MPLAAGPGAVRARPARCSRSTRRSARATRRRSAACSRRRTPGPLRHRYGGVRDLVVGITVALSDGSLAKAGGRVIKNVAGYDLGKLFAGSFGTLGLAVTVALRLHPRPDETATAWGASADPAALAGAAAALAALPLEADCLDVAWRDDAGRAARPLRRRGGRAPGRRGRRPPAARPASRTSRRPPTTTRSGPPSATASARPTAPCSRSPGAPRTSRPCSPPRGTPAAASSAAPRSDCTGSRSRATTSPARVEAVRAALAPRACTLQDAPEAVRAAVAAVGRARPRRARRDAARQGALRPRPDLQPRQLRGRHLTVSSLDITRHERERDPAKRAWDDHNPPSLDLIRDCVHCGFCLPTCPSYNVFEDEMDSPRGRILLMRVGHEEGAQISPEMVTHFDRCLGCMACVTACPSGRPVRPADREHAAAARAPGRPQPGRPACVRRGIFELFTHPGRLRALAPLMALERPARPARPPRERHARPAQPAPARDALARARRSPRAPRSAGCRRSRRRAGRRVDASPSCRAASSGSGSPTSTPRPSASSPPRAGRSTRRRSRAAAARSSCTRASRTRRSRSPARRSPPTRATTRSSPTSPAAARR